MCLMDAGRHRAIIRFKRTRQFALWRFRRFVAEPMGRFFLTAGKACSIFLLADAPSLFDRPEYLERARAVVQRAVGASVS